jgi:hypothetical protein
MRLQKVVLETIHKLKFSSVPAQKTFYAYD